jgi:hypothetical protein
MWTPDLIPQLKKYGSEFYKMKFNLLCEILMKESKSSIQLWLHEFSDKLF